MNKKIVGLQELMLFALQHNVAHIVRHHGRPYCCIGMHAFQLRRNMWFEEYMTETTENDRAHDIARVITRMLITGKRAGEARYFIAEARHLYERKNRAFIHVTLLRG